MYQWHGFAPSLPSFLSSFLPFFLPFFPAYIPRYVHLPQSFTIDDLRVGLCCFL
jgi:hypothetical protein